MITNSMKLNKLAYLFFSRDLAILMSYTVAASWINAQDNIPEPLPELKTHATRCFSSADMMLWIWVWQWETGAKLMLS